MSDDSTPRVTLRGEFLRAERHPARAVSAEQKVAAIEAELVALDELATPEVTPPFNYDASSADQSGCRCCGCVMGDHNDPRQGGGCTNCGDCEGWL